MMQSTYIVRMTDFAERLFLQKHIHQPATFNVNLTVPVSR